MQEFITDPLDLEALRDSILELASGNLFINAEKGVLW